MNASTALLVSSFINRNYERFQAHLDSFDIEPSEAEVIVSELRQTYNDTFQGETIIEPFQG